MAETGESTTIEPNVEIQKTSEPEAVPAEAPADGDELPYVDGNLESNWEEVCILFYARPIIGFLARIDTKPLVTWNGILVAKIIFKSSFLLMVVVDVVFVVVLLVVVELVLLL